MLPCPSVAASAIPTDTGDFVISDASSDAEVSFSATEGLLTITKGEMTLKTTKVTNQCIYIGGPCTLTLDGINIAADTSYGSKRACIQIENNAAFDVTLLLADGSSNALGPASSGSSFQGIAKADDGTKDPSELGTLTIGVPNGATGTGQLEVISGGESSAIGGNSSSGSSQNSYSATNISITGGTIVAKPGYGGCGIGSGRVTSSGYNSFARNITISGGTVYVFGSEGAAAIGTPYPDAGNYKTENIAITGGTVVALGGRHFNEPSLYVSPGIGSWYRSSEGAKFDNNYNNTISGNAVVYATSGGDYYGTQMPALIGFDAASGGSISNAVVFTGTCVDMDDTWLPINPVYDTATLYNNVELSQSLDIPCSLTIPQNQTLSIAKGAEVSLTEQADATYIVEGTIQNKGELTLPKDIAITDTGAITTLLSFDTQGGELSQQKNITVEDNFVVYQTKEGVQTYNKLPSVEKEGYNFDGWFTDKDKGEEVKEGDSVELNQHILYAHWTKIPEPTPTDTISITFATAEGSWQGLHELTIEGEPDQVIVTPQYPEAPADKTCIGWFDEAGMQVISGQTTFAEVTGTVTARYAYTLGWHQNESGWWYVYDLNNNYYIHCWALIHGAWFYFTDQGYCLESCWGYINNVWYYFAAGGYMQTGWQYLNHTWYFLDRYTGEMKTGWQKDGVWYYINPETGAMYNNCWAYINGAWYGFNEGGSMTQGWSWSYAYDGWFYLEPYTGVMQTGWQYIGGHWYYFYDNGLMAANTYVGNYWLGSDGAMW